MTTPLTDAGAGLLDAGALERLRHAARANSPEAVKAVATRFEALFLGMVMKSMREAAPSEGLFESEQGRTMQGMLDQQYAQALASRGIGLADILARQMIPYDTPAAEPDGRNRMPLDHGNGIPAPASASAATAVNDAHRVQMASAPAHHHARAGAPARDPSRSGLRAPAGDKLSAPQQFTQRFTPLAQAASAATGIPAKFMLAQAALESGWGRREIRHADGGHSHNVFGVKAGKGWRGAVADVVTTEYVGGVAQRRVERFRAYGSYAEAFADYARMLTKSARYQAVLASSADAVGFAQGLQKAGYASDPAYADKLRRVIARV